MLTPFGRALIAHLVADWLLQNDWMAKNKTRLVHPAAWVHFSIHAVLLGFTLGWQAGLALGVMHLLIDTRVPLNWWRRVFRQTTDGPFATHTAIWTDQVLHIATIAAWIVLVAR